MGERRYPHLKDALTGAYSRAVFQERLAEEIALSRRHGSPFALIMIDLDHFKSINDAYGHQRGDLALVEFARRVRGVLRRSDQLFRYGGDEFALLLPQTDLARGEALAQRLLSALRERPLAGNPVIHATTSMGVSAFPVDGDTPEALFERADARHYIAKRSGRDRVVSVDDQGEGGPAFAVPRLIERDIPLERVHDFLRTFHEAGSGQLTICGEPGTGRNRFLHEVGKLARMHGMLVLSLQGRREIRSKPYGAVMEALREWEGVSSPVVGLTTFTEAVKRRLQDKGAAGLILTVDGTPELDEQTLLLLRNLFAGGEIPALAIACAVDDGPNRRLLGIDAAVKREVTLEPLSPAGVHLWLRTALQMEPDGAFVAWLHGATRGLPAFIEQALEELSRQGVISRTAGGWVIASDYTTVPLEEILQTWWQAPDVTLPVVNTSFVGREGELQEIKERLPNRRLITLLGPGGTGKTRLAMQTAAEVSSQYRHGICFVPLASVSGPDLLVPALASALRLPLHPQPGAREQVVEYLRDKEMLLVLDNFEHLVHVADFVAEMLEMAPELTVIVTSRERLRLPGESILEVEGLSVPEGADLRSAALSSSVQLFVDRARLMREEFTLQAGTVSHVVRICRLVQGMPLGLELAAAWVRMLSCQEIADGISRSLSFLDAAVDALPAQYRSLRSAFNHSWALLSTDEQRVFAALSVFRGGFDREAAEKVAQATFPVLASLMDKSLIRRAGVGRYEVHELLRQYGAEMLSPDRSSQLSQLHAAHYLGVVEAAAPLFVGPKQIEVRDRLKADQDNLRAAMAWAIGAGESEAALRLSGGLRIFWWITGQMLEGQDWLNAALAVDPVATPTHARARALTEAAWLKHQQGDRKAAYAMASEALEIFRSLQDSKGQAEALYTLGGLAMRLGQYDESRRRLAECLVIQRSLGDRTSVSSTLSALGILAFDKGDDATSLAYLEEALAIRRELEDENAVSIFLSNLGTLLLRIGNYDKAEAHFSESLQLMEARGLGGHAMPVHGLGDLALLRGDHDQARERLLQALDLKRKTGLHAHLGHSFFSLSAAARRTGDAAGARRWCQEGLANILEVSNQQAFPAGLVHAAAVAYVEEQYERAARLIGAAESALAFIGRALEAVAAREYQDLVQGLSAGLGNERFTLCRGEGTLMTLSQAMDYAKAN